MPRFEAALGESLAAEPPSAAGPMTELVGAGGKRLRPALVLLCAKLGEYDLEQALPAALAVELLHAATLVHDDVIDRSATRRGRPTVYATRGEAAGILVGDFHFAKAYREASRAGAEVVDELARAVMVICDGELKQQADRYRYRPSEAEYLARIQRKTAQLLEAACAVGALLGGLEGPVEAVLRAYGHHLGLAFQIADDVLDYTSEEREVGKPVGHDLLEGSATLPLMLALAHPIVGPELEQLLPEGRPLTPEQVTRVVDLVRGCGATQEALARARDIAGHGRRRLEELPSHPAVEAMAALADYVVSRNI